MKKVVAILLAGVLMLGATVTAFAAPSPSTTSDTASIEATSETGKVRINSTYETEEQKNAAEALAAAPLSTLEDVVGATEASGMVLKDVFNVTVDGYTEGDPVTITFAVSGVTSSSKVIVLHYTGGAWVQEKSISLGSGTVTVNFDSLSPVAIYVDSETAAAASSSSSSTTTSPSTGEAPLMAGVFAAIAIAAAGMVISRKKMFA